MPRWTKHLNYFPLAFRVFLIAFFLICYGSDSAAAYDNLLCVREHEPKKNGN